MRVTSEGSIKITKATIDAAWRRRKADCRLIIRDKDCRGLALIVNATSMSWSYAYRPRGTDPLTGRRWPNRTMTLGNPATHSPDDARAEANRFKGQAAANGDPVAERKAAAEAARRKRSATLARLVDDYARRSAEAAEDAWLWRSVASLYCGRDHSGRMALRDMNATAMPVVELTDALVRRMLSAAHGVTTARHRFGALSRFLDWCQDAGYIQINPCALIARARRPRAPQARAHYLTPGELARLWRVADGLREPVWRDLAQFLIAVPCRRGEAARLEWSHVDIGAKEWRQPGRMTKNREWHRLHLHPLALDVLHARHAATGGKGLVFPAPVSGGVMDTFTDIKQSMADAAALTGWTWHDFRRSFATALGEAGISEVVADAVLNHRQSATRGGVLGIYQRASRWPEQVRAMELWGQLLVAALAKRDDDAPRATLVG